MDPSEVESGWTHIGRHVKYLCRLCCSSPTVATDPAPQHSSATRRQASGTTDHSSVAAGSRSSSEPACRVGTKTTCPARDPGNGGCKVGHDPFRPGHRTRPTVESPVAIQPVRAHPDPDRVAPARFSTGSCATGYKEAGSAYLAHQTPRSGTARRDPPAYSGHRSASSRSATESLIQAKPRIAAAREPAITGRRS